MGIYWDSVAKYGSQNKAAQALGIPRTTFQARLLKESAPPKTTTENKLIHYGTPRILLWDIETAPMVAAVWGLFDQNLTPDAIIQDWYIICACWKWHGEEETHSISLIDDPLFAPGNHSDDEIIVRKLHEILGQADFIVAQNGDSFDMKKFMARAIYHGLPPLPKIPSVDTLKEARKSFKFSSNKLDYLTQHLSVGAKMNTEKGLWMRALKGSRSAIQSMVDYCKQDVVILEALYDKMRPYMKAHPNMNAVQQTGHCCAKCGSPDIARNGKQLRSTGYIQQWLCNACGAYSVGKKLAERAELR